MFANLLCSLSIPISSASFSGVIDRDGLNLMRFERKEAEVGVGSIEIEIRAVTKRKVNLKQEVLGLLVLIFWVCRDLFVGKFWEV